MITKVVVVDPVCPEPGFLVEGGAVLRQGGLVAFPTETVYGLGANAWDGVAVEGIFAAKGRPGDNPLIVHIAQKESIEDLVREVPRQAEVLMEAFWPGPLTVILPVSERVPVQVTAGLDTIALRVPDHPVALGLIRAAGVPVAAPSANTSGRPSPTTARHVMEDLEGRIEMIIDGGATGVGVESTVIDLTTSTPTVLRPGGITLEALRIILPKVEVLPPGLTAQEEASPPRSPGMKYTHYAPKAPLYLVEGHKSEIADRIKAMATEYSHQGRRVGILTYGDTDYSPYGQAIQAGHRHQPETIAASLYAALRTFDQLEVDVILAEGVEEEGIGLAIMNRLRKASRKG